MSLLAEYTLFLAKTLTVLFSILLILGKIFASKSKSSNKAKVTIKKINEQFSDLKQHMQSKALSKSELKKWQKNEKKVLQLESSITILVLSKEVTTLKNTN